MVMLQQMIVLFLLMAVGYLCCRVGIMTEESSKKISAIVVNVANPCLVLESGLSENKVPVGELLTTLVIVIVMYTFLLLMASALPKLLGIPTQSKGTYGAMTVFTNLGFMGFPVLTAMYGSSALLYAAFFMIPFNVLIYTYGIGALSVPDISPDGVEQKSLRTGTALQTIKKIMNVGVVACILAIFLYFFQIPVPQFLRATITNLGNLTAPLSMMVIGASLATISIKDLFLDGKLLLFSLIKLLVIPGLFMLLVCRFVEPGILRGVCLVMVATPVASMTAMLAQQSDGDYETASKGVALTTILSVITMPVLAAIFL